MASVTLSRLSKNYGQAQAVKCVDLEVREGEFIVLVGPSGCGKTTTLRMIAGLEEISGGDILIDNARVNDLTPRERNVAMVFQNYSLYSHMSVRDNLAFGLRMRREAPAEIAEKVNRIAETLHIAPLLDRNPSQLSGGERQRVAIGRALVRNPRVYLMDEPLSNLDAKLRTEMRAEIKRIHQEFGTTTVFVTHDQAEAMSLADRLVVMNNGCIVQSGTPLEVYDHPVNTFVAQFIGNPSMNLIRGDIRRENGDLKFESSVIAFTLLPETAAAARDGSSSTDAGVLLGIRPEHMWISLQKDEAPNQFAAEIILVEPLGAQSLVLLRMGKDEIRVITDSRLRIKSYDRVFLNFNIEDTVLFRANSGETLGVN